MNFKIAEEFAEGSKSAVVLGKIGFTSLCEHLSYKQFSWIYESTDQNTEIIFYYTEMYLYLNYIYNVKLFVKINIYNVMYFLFFLNI